MAFTKVDTKQFKTGEIKFSSFREIFADATSGSIAFSELYRSNADDAYVPDALENLNIPTSGEIKTSNFRNSIKEVKISQGVDDVDTNVTTSDKTNIIDKFNSYNIAKNVRKTIEVNGTIGATSSLENGAFYHDDKDYKNLRLLITSTGKMYGKGGAAGSKGANGGDGGNVIRTTSAINIINNGLLYAGGGGGGGGGKGGTGGKGGDGKYDVFVSKTCTRPIENEANYELSGRNMSWNPGKTDVYNYPGWSDFMNKNAISFRTSNANGQSDSGSATIKIPGPGKYTVYAAADNANQSDTKCQVGSVSCSVGPLTSGGNTTELNIAKARDLTVSITIKNAFEPPENGGDSFSTNPMGMAIKITGTYKYYTTQYYDCSYTDTRTQTGASGGSGGDGGTGGRGRGYDYKSPEILTGSSGKSGKSGGTGSNNAGNGGDGGDGGDGGAGGDWGESGDTGDTGDIGFKGTNGNKTNAPNLTSSNNGSKGGNEGAAGYYISGVGVTFTNNGEVKGQYRSI